MTNQRPTTANYSFLVRLNIILSYNREDSDRRYSKTIPAGEYLWKQRSDGPRVSFLDMDGEIGSIAATSHSVLVSDGVLQLTSDWLSWDRALDLVDASSRRNRDSNGDGDALERLSRPLNKRS